MATSNLFDFVPAGEAVSPFASLPLAGAAFDPARDTKRLTRQVDCIVAVVIGGDWWTIQKLVQACRKRYRDVGFPENSVHAQLRNLRKIGYRVERRHIVNGLHEYRVLPPVNPGVGAALRAGRVDA